MMTIGECIAEIRKESHLSQEAFGESLGVTRQAISKWESNVSIPDVDKLILISKTYNVTVGWILGIEDKTPNEEFTESQLELVREIVKQCTKELEQKIAEGEPHSPVAKAPPKQKKRKFLIFLACAAILIFAVWCSNLSEQLRSLKNSQNYLQSQITSVESSVYNQTNVLTGQIEEILNAQNSVLADFGYNILGYDYAADTVDIEVYIVPKTYTEGMTTEFAAVSDDETFTVAGAESDGHRFKGTVKCKLSDCITLTVAITSGDIVETQLIDVIYHAKEQTIPTVYFSSSSIWGPTDYNSGNFKHEEEIFIAEDKYSEAYFKGIYITDVTVYLIINNKVTDEFICTRSDTSRDLADWTVSFPFDYDIKNGDTMHYAAVATDNYGRQHLVYDMRYIVEDDIIDYDVSYKFDNTGEDIYGLLD